MTYSEIRPSLRSGDLLLCSGTSWFSRLIQAATGSEWSHVGLILRVDSLDRVDVSTRLVLSFYFPVLRSWLNLTRNRYPNRNPPVGEGFERDALNASLPFEQLLLA